MVVDGLSSPACLSKLSLPYLISEVPCVLGYSVRLVIVQHLDLRKVPAAGPEAFSTGLDPAGTNVKVRGTSYGDCHLSSTY